MNTMKTIGTVFAVAVGSLYGSSVYANEPISAPISVMLQPEPRHVRKMAEQ